MARPSRGEPPRTEAILSAALEIFLREGYGAASVDAIVQRAAVSKATLYRHFADKDALLRAVLEGAAAEALGGARPADHLRGAPGEALRAFGAALLSAIARPASVRVFRLVIAEAERFPELSRSFYRTITEPTVGALAAWIRARAASGELAVADADLAALQLLGLFKEALFWPTLMGARGPGREAKEVVARAVEVFLRAYAPGGGRSPARGRARSP